MFKATAINDLDHDVRNATVSLSGLVEKIKDPAFRLEAKKQIMRIEQALIRYEGKKE